MVKDGVRVERKVIESGSWNRRNDRRNATGALDIGMLLAEG
jgi:hypothetical protein